MDMIAQGVGMVAQVMCVTVQAVGMTAKRVRMAV